MLVSEFFDENLQIPPFVLGAFFSRFVLKSDYIYTYSMYRNSKFLSSDEFEKSQENYINILNLHSNDNFWEVNNYKEINKKNYPFVCVLQNDLNLNNDEFYTKLLRKIFLSEFFLNSDLSEAKKSFIR